MTEIFECHLQDIGKHAEADLALAAGPLPATATAGRHSRVPPVPPVDLHHARAETPPKLACWLPDAVSTWRAWHLLADPLALWWQPQLQNSIERLSVVI